MQEKLIKLFTKAKYEPEVNFEEKAWRAVVVHDKHMALFQLWIFFFIGIFSLAGLVPMVKILFSDFAKSGFYEYISLAFSDSGLIMSNLKEYVFSLVESLPMVSIILSFSLIFVFFMSLRYTTKQIIRNQLSF